MPPIFEKLDRTCPECGRPMYRLNPTADNPVTRVACSTPGCPNSLTPRRPSKHPPPTDPDQLHLDL